MAKKLIFDVDAIQTCRKALDTSKTNLEAIQKSLQGAVETLVEAENWKSDGSTAFVEKYSTTWVEGSNDRIAVIQRMIDHLDSAIAQYGPIEQEVIGLKLEAGPPSHGGSGRRF